MGRLRLLKAFTELCILFDISIHCKIMIIIPIPDGYIKIFMKEYPLFDSEPPQPLNSSVTSIYFLLTISSLNQTSGYHENKGNVYQRKETIDCFPNSPCLHLRKCVKNSTENNHTHVRVGRGK